MTVLIRLSDQRLARVGWRLDSGKKFSIAIPERTLTLGRQWSLCLILADEPLVWDMDELVLDEEAEPGPSVVALARIRSSPRPTTTDDRVVLAESELIAPLSLRTLASEVNPPNRREVRAASKAIATDLSQSGAEATIAALLRLRPHLGATIERLQRGGNEEPVTGAKGEILAFERDAARLALSIAGVDAEPLQEWDGVSDEGFLRSLAYDTNEDVLVSHDATRFPDWSALAGGRPDWMTFSNGDNTIRIGNVNRTKLERTLGVDLIYRHIEADTVVLVQYKRMRKDANGEWYYRPERQLAVELDRMRRFDSEIGTEETPKTWRLHPRGFVIKLVRQPREFDPQSDRLLSGIYLPLAYYDELLADDSTLTSKGSRRLGYNTIDRYLTSDLFVALVRQGWIGTRGQTTAAIASLIDAAVNAGRSVIVAEESGEQSGSTRRRRPTRA